MASLFGPHLGPSQTEFRLWAPSADTVSLIVENRSPQPMKKYAGGFWSLALADCGSGTRYKFAVGDLEFPDPASRQQQGGTSGWSVVVEPIAPSGRTEPIRPWHETLICEIHIGTATPEGTFRALADRLEHFRDAGFTALEIMPINTFPGMRNWGYDGTLIFAPAEAYGTREDFRALVDRAHALGLGVILDVVYNHFGDFDNFIADYAPEWFDDEVETPWGPGIDFRQDQVRQFYYENAQMWLSEFDVDGLRFDSVHEMKTECRDSFLTDLAASCREVKGHAKLIIENMENMASWLERDGDGDPKDFTAQWDDDVHHVLEFLVTGENKNGYDDGSEDPIANLEKGLADGFIHDGEASGESDGTTREEPGSRLPPDAFVSYVQNHDQIGNRADSARLPDRIGPRKLDFLHFVMMLAPQIPLLFMGEEANVCSPFPFFLDLPEDAAARKAEDRYRQMREIFNEDVEDGDLPDPNDPQTFLSAKLDWAEYDEPECRASLQRFQQLVGWRRGHVWPIAATRSIESESRRQGNAILVSWIFEGGTLNMALNPDDAPGELSCVVTQGSVAAGKFEQKSESVVLDGWSAVAWTS